MKRNRFTAEAIIRMLREAEVDLSQGETIAQVSRELGITEQTYYRWRKEYGEMKVRRGLSAVRITCLGWLEYIIRCEDL